MKVKDPLFKKGDIVRYPNKGYDYRIAECLGFDDSSGQWFYEIVFDKPFTERGKKFREREGENYLVKKDKK